VIGRTIGGALLLGLLASQTYLGCAPVHAQGERYRITTCLLAAESDTVNHRSEMAYYNCGASAAFMMVVDAPGELRLRELSGRTVDILVEVVK
jgi:hypothetical protein